MASSVPVVATGVGGIPEVIQDGVSGHLIYSREPEQFAQQVIGLLSNDSLRTEMGERARRVFESRFTVGQMVSEYTDLYERLLAVKGARR
jgi:glycosyltransferase involved in cell wall biosynthesis